MLLGVALPLVFLAIETGDDDDNNVSEVGSEADDTLEGDTGDDFLDGQAGDDILNGGAGDDTIFGRDGDDVLEGEDGDDMLCSGEGDDVVTGNRGNDLLEGQGGDDFVSGDYGSDVVRGDDGNDTVLGGRGTDTVNGGAGDDVVFGGIIEGVPLNLEELELLRDGGSLEELNGDIDLRDDSIGNVVWGGEGDDDLILGSGDVANGNAGADTYHIMSDQVNADAVGAATISSFEPDEDSITIIVDDTEDDAEISVTDDGEDAVIRLGDTILARVEGSAGTLTAADISLISERSVAGLFDPNA